MKTVKVYYCTLKGAVFISDIIKGDKKMTGQIQKQDRLELAISKVNQDQGNLQVEDLVAIAILAKKLLFGISARLSPQRLPSDKYERALYLCEAMDKIGDVARGYDNVVILLVEKLGVSKQRYDKIKKEIYSKETKF